jgi:hypothetical protein
LEFTNNIKESQLNKYIHYLFYVHVMLTFLVQ